MNDQDELDRLIREYPIIANCVVPALVVGFAMLTLLGGMSLIQWILK